MILKGLVIPDLERFIVEYVGHPSISACSSEIFKNLKFSNSDGVAIRSDPTDFADLLYPIPRVVPPSKYVCRH